MAEHQASPHKEENFSTNEMDQDMNHTSVHSYYSNEVREARDTVRLIGHLCDDIVCAKRTLGMLEDFAKMDWSDGKSVCSETYRRIYDHLLAQRADAIRSLNAQFAALSKEDQEAAVCRVGASALLMSRCPEMLEVDLPDAVKTLIINELNEDDLPF